MSIRPDFRLAADLSGVPEAEIEKAFENYRHAGGPFDVSPMNRTLRMISTPVLRLLGPSGRTLTSFAKKTRNNDQPVPHVFDMPLARMAMERGPKHAGVVVLTHDVDWDSCYRILPDIVEMERRHGFRSSINILTEWWYRPDKKWLEELRDDGFEIGLHGRFHDPGIAYRPRAKIADELKRALDALPEGVTGYRSPALSVSDTLYEVLEELGFTHDSSLLVLNRYGAGCPLIWPFKIGSIAELPLTMQDDLLFRDMGLDVETALRITLERMDKALKAGGWFVLNTHPGVLEGRLNYYESLLSAISERGIKPMTAMEAVKTIEPHPAR